MRTKSKFFRVFVEGNTISDGRKVTAEMIDEVVSTFNAETYSPRINVEHLKGFSPEPPFNGYGDVAAVRAQTDTITIDGKAEQRRALYAQVEGNEQLVALSKADQKPFPSVELTDSYAGTGKVGMIGMAFTDSPASIATQRLQFSRNTPGSVFAHSGDVIALEFDPLPADPAKVDGAIAGFFNALTAKFKGAEPEKKEEPKPKPANDNFDIAAFTSELQVAVTGSIAAAVKPISDAHDALKAEFATLRGTLANVEQPQGFSRPPATGGGGDQSMLTDC